MDVSSGLPNTVPGTTGEQLVEWAKRAEARGFASLGTIERLLYPNYEPLTALAAAAAVTARIGLVTNVVLGPLRANAAVLAKQALSVHALSGERLTLGIGLGGREDDFEFAGLPLGKRGDELDAMLTTHVSSSVDEWKATLDDPDRLARFVSFVNAPETPDPSIQFTTERGQPVPVPLGAHP